MPWLPSVPARGESAVLQAAQGTNKYKCRLWKRIRMYKLRKNQLCEQCCKRPSEEVHHCNGDADDNRPANLRALCRFCHSRITVRDRINRGR